MTAPSSLALSVPPTFPGSFWSAPGYRKGLHALYSKLQAGLDENASVIKLIEHRTDLEYRHAEALATPAPLPDFPNPLFKDGLFSTSATPGVRALSASESLASHAFRALENEAVTAQSAAHAKVARGLERNVLIPFEKWSTEHEQRVRSSWEHVDATLARYERQKAEVERLKASYETKCRAADEAEDVARFAGGDVPSPSIVSSVSDQTLASSAPTKDSSVEPEEKDQDEDTATAAADPEKLKRRETIREQFGFRKGGGRHASANASTLSSSGDKFTPLSPRAASAELGGTAAATRRQTRDGSEESNFSAALGSATGTLKRSGTITAALSSVISRASEAPALQNLRSAVGGLSEPRHLRLRKEAEGAESAYRSGVRNLDVLRERTEETLMDHYRLAERWELDRLVAVRRVLGAFFQAFTPLLPSLSVSLQRSAALEAAIEPVQSLTHIIVDARTGPYQPKAEVFQPYYHDEASTPPGAGVAGFGMDLVAFNRAKTLATTAAAAEDDDIGNASISSDITTILSPKGLPSLPLALSALLSALDKAYADDSKWPKPRPAPPAAASKAEEGADAKPAEEDEKSASLALNEEKRKAWIYDVPLIQSHTCREAIIGHLVHAGSSSDSIDDLVELLLAKFDPPTLAATTKLWALELTHSLVPAELWETVNNVYVAAAAQEKPSSALPATPADEAGKDEAAEGTPSKADKGKGRVGLSPELQAKITEGVLQDLGVVLGKLPKIHLVCLDALVGQLSRLLKSTPTKEADSLYLNKLGLALGRTLIRPPYENGATLASKAPTLLAMDLIGHYQALLPALVERKAQESESAAAQQRRTPIRKRTKPIDQRLSRSRIAAGAPPVPVLPPKSAEAGSTAENGAMPLSPVPIDDVKSAGSPTKPKVDTAKLAPAGEDAEVPTPIAERVLGSTAEGKKEKEDKAGSSGETRTETAVIDEDKPLSNVARLSRQFGSTGSGTRTVGGPRGARPMGARSAANNASSTSTASTGSSSKAANRESKDLAPSSALNGSERPPHERRRSWSRTIELNDAELVDGDD